MNIGTTKTFAVNQYQIRTRLMKKCQRISWLRPIAKWSIASLFGIIIVCAPAIAQGDDGIDDANTITHTPADKKAKEDVNNKDHTYAIADGAWGSPCTFTPNFSFLTNNISSTGTTISFSFAFISPATGWNGGLIGTIGAGCRPTSTRTITVTDGATPSRSWSVTIQPSGVVSIFKTSGPATTTSYPPIVLNSSFPI